MTRSLSLLAAAGLALALAGCEPGDYDEAPEPAPEAPAAADAATDVVAEEAPPADETAPTPEPEGQLPEPAAGEETVEPESDTLFY